MPRPFQESSSEEPINTESDQLESQPVRLLPAGMVAQRGDIWLDVATGCNAGPLVQYQRKTFCPFV